MGVQHKNRIFSLRIAVTVVFISIAACLIVYSHLSNGFAETGSSSDANADSREAADYSKFSHSVRQHQRDCKTCHVFPSGNWESVREKGDAIPDITDYPKHVSCLNCHRRQFFSGPKPVICRICHTNPSPNDSSRHPFPNPREVFDLSAKGKRSVTNFGVFFPHEMHVAIMGENVTPSKSKLREGYLARASFGRTKQADVCTTCHTTYLPQDDGDEEYVTPPPETLGDGFWLKKGTFKSMPINHLQCFTCHSEDAGMTPAPSDCGTCHKPKDVPKYTDFDAEPAKTMGITDKQMLSSWSKRNSAARFRHEWFSHVELDCATCHKTEAIDTLNQMNKTVSITSCNGCHVTATLEDGGNLNIEIESRTADPGFQCAKCHLSYSGLAIPDTHFKAIKDLAVK